AWRSQWRLRGGASGGSVRGADRFAARRTRRPEAEEAAHPCVSGRPCASGRRGSLVIVQSPSYAGLLGADAIEPHPLLGVNVCAAFRTWCCSWILSTLTGTRSRLPVAILARSRCSRRSVRSVGAT